MEIKYYKGYHVITRTPEEQGFLPADGRSLNKEEYLSFYNTLKIDAHNPKKEFGEARG